MKIKTLSYRPNAGWSEPFCGELDSDRTLVLLFAAPEYFDTPHPLREIHAAFSRSQVVGCSTSGEIFGNELRDHSIAAAVVRFDHTPIATAFAPSPNPAASFDCGAQLGRSLNRPDLRAILLFSDGLTVNGSDLLRGIASVVSSRVSIGGGLAGDGDRFRRTWILRDGQPQVGWVGAVGLYGNAIEIGQGSRGGWNIFGVERRITRSVGNVVHEMDGRPVLDLYREYLGDLASGLPATGLFFPLAMRSPCGASRLVRTLLSVDESEKSMTFAGDVPEGSFAQLMRANVDRLIDGAAQAGADAATPEHRASESTPAEQLSIAVSCVGRRLVLDERTDEEIEVALAELSPGTHQIGFYSYGEVAACGGCGLPALHNQTMTLTTLRESADADR